MSFTILRCLVVAGFVLGGAACTKKTVLTAASIEGRDVIAPDLPEMTKLIDSCRLRLAPSAEGIPQDAITIDAVDPEHGALHYFYSPSRKAIFWRENEKSRTLACSVSGHFSMVIEKCFKHAE